MTFVPFRGYRVSEFPADEQERTDGLPLQRRIEAVDCQIDALVYEL